jgi:competence protein ComEC
MMSSARRPKMAEEAWTCRAASDIGEVWPVSGRSADGALACDSSGCLYRARGHTVAVVRDGRAMGEDCGLADLVIGEVPLSRRCRARALVIGPRELRENGTHAVWLEADGVRVESVDALRGKRPWVPSRGITPRVAGEAPRRAASPGGQ